MKRRLVTLPVIVLAVGAFSAYLYTKGSGSPPRFYTASVERGDLISTVVTTGTLNAVTTVMVGTQVSGQVRELFADFNSPVKKNQLIARIDPTTFEAKVNQARAEVEGAEANVLTQAAQVQRARAEIASAQATVSNQRSQIERARADVENARAALASARAQTAKAAVALLDATRDLDRKTGLLRKDLISRSEHDSAQAARDSAAAQMEASRAQEQALSATIRSALAQVESSRSQEQALRSTVSSAEAQLQVAEAQRRGAEASVRQKRAALQLAIADLEHTFIRSPVDGVVVSRTVDVGQTVAAALAAPTLFTIAQDLTKMQVDTNVDEADMGRIRLGQRATFTVDSYPGETFPGSVVQVRTAAKVVQNVVTYNVVIGVDNAGRKLLPGLTANIRIEVDARSNALKMPNAALRFRPPLDETAGSAASGASPARRATSSTSVASVEETREQLTRELGLSEPQRKQLEPILHERREQLMATSRAPKERRRAASLRAREEARLKIRAILTPPQQTVFDQLPAGQPAVSGAPDRPGAVWVRESDGQLRAITLRLGITDGSFTEVLAGDLKEGQEVIVGTSAAPPSAATGGPRLRL